MSPRPTQTLSDDSGIKHRVASGSARTLTSPPDSASPRFLSDTRLCPTMTSKSLCRSTVGQNAIVGSGSIQTLTSSPGSASPRFLSDTRHCQMVTSESCLSYDSAWSWVGAFAGESRSQWQTRTDFRVRAKVTLNQHTIHFKRGVVPVH